MRRELQRRRHLPQVVVLLWVATGEQVGSGQTPHSVPFVGQPTQASPSLPFVETRTLSRKCMCAVDPKITNGGVVAVGCGSWGYGRKWCYVTSPNCSDSGPGAKYRSPSNWRYCSGYICMPYFQLPGLQFLELRVQTVLTGPQPMKDWPDCCGRCSLTEDCAAWRFSFLRDSSNRCELFLGSTRDPVLARTMAKRLQETAVQFDVKVSPFGSQIYGLPGYDDAPRVCPGVRWAASIDDFAEGGWCISFLLVLYLAGTVLVTSFACCCFPWAWQWIRFAQAAHENGKIVPCTVTPVQVRHEWHWETQTSLPGGGIYRYRPVHEVRLEWEYPSNVLREMTFVDTTQTDHVFDRLVPTHEPAEAYAGYPLPGARELPRTFYRIGAGMLPDVEEERVLKPSSGVWKIDVPTNASAVEFSGLVDSAHEDVVVPFIMEKSSWVYTMLRSLCASSQQEEDEDGTGARAMLRPVFGVPFCLCGFVASLPFFTLAMLKLLFPLLADGWIPVRLQGFNSAHTVSRYLPTLGLWDLSTMQLAAQSGLVVVLAFCCFCALPWWQCYARTLLSNVEEVPWSYTETVDRSETERLLSGH